MVRSSVSDDDAVPSAKTREQEEITADQVGGK